VAGLEGGLVDQPLRGEAVERRHTGQRQTREQEDAEGDGHLAAQSAQLIQRGRMAGHHDAAGAQEQQVLEHHVIDEVHQAAGNAERSAERQRHGDVAELAHCAVDQQAFDAGLQHGHRTGVEHGDAADDCNSIHQQRHAGDHAEAVEQCCAAEYHEHFQNTVGTALQQHGRDITGDRRRRGGRVHLVVDAYRQHRCFHQHAEDNHHQCRA
jgi:hypothetical protein